MLTASELLHTVFSTTDTQVNNHIISGRGTIQAQAFHIIGTVENTSFGVEESLEMASQVIQIVQQGSTTPLVLLVDVTGQKLSVRDEWLGMYAYFAHLLKCLHLLREQGNTIISLVYNQAIGGSFIAFGMMADKILALDTAQLAVMWLEGMAKVTKIDINTLRQLSESSPVFAPGVENFRQLGGIHEVLKLQDVANHLLLCAQEPTVNKDTRAKLGKRLGGRTMAYDLIQEIKK